MGDLVLVYHQDDSGWWAGESNKQFGWFPKDFVVQLPAQNARYVFFIASPLPLLSPVANTLGNISQSSFIYLVEEASFSTARKSS